MSLNVILGLSCFVRFTRTFRTKILMMPLILKSCQREFRIILLLERMKLISFIRFYLYSVPFYQSTLFYIVTIIYIYWTIQNAILILLCDVCCIAAEQFKKTICGFSKRKFQLSWKQNCTQMMCMIENCIFSTMIFFFYNLVLKYTGFCFTS